MALTGSETLQVLGQNPTGKPAAATFTTTTQEIANLVGAGSYGGTFVLTGTTPVTVTNANVALTSLILPSLNTVGGTVGALPSAKTITAGVGFTISGTAGDTSTYNYGIL